MAKEKSIWLDIITSGADRGLLESAVHGAEEWPLREPCSLAELAAVYAQGH